MREKGEKKEEREREGQKGRGAGVEDRHGDQKDVDNLREKVMRSLNRREKNMHRIKENFRRGRGPEN